MNPRSTRQERQRSEDSAGSALSRTFPSPAPASLPTICLQPTRKPMTDANLTIEPPQEPNFFALEEQLKPAHVLLWSRSQQALSLETHERMLERNRSAYAGNVACDYVMLFIGPKELCRQMLLSLSNTVSRRNSGERVSADDGASGHEIQELLPKVIAEVIARNEQASAGSAAPAREQLIAWARQAGLPMSWLDEGKASAWPELERFAALVIAGTQPRTNEHVPAASVKDPGTIPHVNWDERLMEMLRSTGSIEEPGQPSPDEDDPETPGNGPVDS